MAFPKNFVCVNLVDFSVLNENEKMFAKRLFLPIEMREKYWNLFGCEDAMRGDARIFLNTKGMPECLPRNFFKKRNRKFNGFFLLSALHNKKSLRFVDEKKLIKCCQKKNVQKWLRAFEKNEVCEMFAANEMLFRICAFLLSCCRVV
jgi:hypothetical protein